MSPTANWGPSNPEDQIGKYAKKPTRGFDNHIANVDDHFNSAVHHDIGVIQNELQGRTEQL